MKARIYAASLFIALVAGPALAAADSAFPSGVYAGTIGAHQIVAEFEKSVDSPKTKFGGEYFYRDHGVSIGLDGRRGADGTFIVHEAQSGDTWNLRANGTGLKGTWTASHSNASHPIALKWIGVASNTYDPYNAAVLVAPLTTVATQTLAGHTIVTRSDPRYGVRSFELVGNEPGIARAAANTTLAADFDRRRLEAFDCLNIGINGTLSTSYDETARVAYAGARVLTVYRTVDYFCGGAHPDGGVETLTLDLRSGNAVDWDHAIADGDAIERIYSREVQPVLAHSQPECIEDGALEHPENFVFGIVAGGLLVHGQYVHVAAVCGREIVIPTAVARRLLAPSVRGLLP